jgi:hypothetical protein
LVGIGAALIAGQVTVIQHAWLAGGLIGIPTSLVMAVFSLQQLHVPPEHMAGAVVQALAVNLTMAVVVGLVFADLITRISLRLARRKSQPTK